MSLRDLSIIIPAFNEAEIISQTLSRITKYLESWSGDYEIIVVNDGSIDQTSEKVRYFESENVNLISHGSNKGKGAAVKTGVLAAQYDWLLITDADLSTPIDELDIFFNYLDYDVIIGSRGLPESKVVIHQPHWRESGGKVLNLFIRVFAVKGIRDTQCGFKLFKKSAAHKIFSQLTIAGYGFDVEALYLARKFGFKIKELPVAWYNRENTRVRPFRDGLKILGNLVKIRFNNWRGIYEP